MPADEINRLERQTQQFYLSSTEWNAETLSKFCQALFMMGYEQSKTAGPLTPIINRQDLNDAEKLKMLLPDANLRIN